MSYRKYKILFTFVFLLLVIKPVREFSLPREVKRSFILQKMWGKVPIYEQIHSSINNKSQIEDNKRIKHYNTRGMRYNYNIKYMFKKLYPKSLILRKVIKKGKMIYLIKEG